MPTGLMFTCETSKCKVENCKFDNPFFKQNNIMAPYVNKRWCTCMQ